MVFLKQFFKKYFFIHPNELYLVQLFFIYLMLVSAFYTFSFSVAETIFLQSFSLHLIEILLPWIYISTAVLTILITFIYDHVFQKFSRIKLLIGTDLVVALGIIILKQFSEVGLVKEWMRFFLLIWVESCCVFKITLFYSYLGDYFPLHTARRIYGYVTNGLALGSTIAGYLLYKLSDFFSTPHLLYFSVLLLVLNSLMVLMLSKQTKIKFQNEKTLDLEKQKPILISSIISNPYIKIIFMIVLLGTMVGMFSDYLMLLVASQSFKHDEFAKFFGKLYGYTGALQLAVGFLLSSWLIRRFGVIKNLFVLPSLVAFSALGFVIHPVLFLAL